MSRSPLCSIYTSRIWFDIPVMTTGIAVDRPFFCGHPIGQKAPKPKSLTRLKPQILGYVLKNKKSISNHRKDNGKSNAIYEQLLTDPMFQFLHNVSFDVDQTSSNYDIQFPVITMNLHLTRQVSHLSYSASNITTMTTYHHRLATMSTSPSSPPWSSSASPGSPSSSLLSRFLAEFPWE